MRIRVPLRQFGNLLLLLVCAFFLSTEAWSAQLPSELKGVGITEHLGRKVAIGELRFRDESGKVLPLSTYFHRGRPVLLSLVYYDCPNLCTFTLNGMVKAMKSLKWAPGKDFEVVNVSIDPKEGPALASKKKSAYLAAYGRPGAESGWHFLTGEKSQIAALADQIGFRFHYVPAEHQFAHPAALYVLTPDGKISRYLYGIDFRPTDVKLALLEASNGKIGNVVDRILLYCYRYDPHTKRYSVVLTKVMQVSSGGCALFFGAYLGVFWNRQRRSLRQEREPDSHV